MLPVFIPYETQEISCKFQNHSFHVKHITLSLPISLSNVTKTTKMNREKLYIRLTSFLKITTQSISIFFKFFHPLQFAVLLVPSFHAPSGRYCFVSVSSSSSSY